MKIKDKLLFLASFSVAILLMPPNYCLADETGYLEIYGSLSYANFMFEEVDKGDKLLEETGTIPGLSLGFEYGERNNWFLAGEVEFQIGKVDYNGQTTTGIPITTKTQEDIVDVNLSGGYWFWSKNYHSLGGYGGLGYRSWDRNILATNSVNSLYEQYRAKYAFVGIKWYRENKQITWGLDLRYHHTLQPEMSVFVAGRDTVELELGAKGGFSVSMPVRFDLNEKISFYLKPWIFYWDFGRSDSVIVYNAGQVVRSMYEPDSSTIISGAKFGIIYKF